MMLKIFRRGTARIGFIVAILILLICLYYIIIGQSTIQTSKLISKELNLKSKLTEKSSNNKTKWSNWFDSKASKRKDVIELEDENALVWEECSLLQEAHAEINTKEVFSKFEFEPDWMKTKEYWDKDFENRYEKLMNDPHRQPLKVIVTPHSHNDPGWLKTFVNYFQSDTKQILNLAVTKMPEFHNMSFIWSEISFLNLWWEQAHPSRQRALKKLIEEGRLEITTGGWVMTDEANVHLYAMLDQLIEGHQWVKTNLNFIPKSGWSIDPFGHGSTVPYLLASSGFEGTIIQRIHYNWKQWFGKNQASDFLWKPHWSSPKSKHHTILTHNMPYDIYSIKHSCGPHPFICLNFDFRKIPGEYTEYSVKAQFITEENIQQKADLLMEQYTRTGSMFPHNVALIPVGDDFRYNHEREFNQQYENYKKLIDYINANSATRYHNATIQFGTPIDYFRAIEERQKHKFPTLVGDFFVYADIFNEARPAYWSGYFTTRPFYKLMSRELEHNLRSLEILFTLAFNKARQHNLSNAYKVYEKNYEKIIQARRNLGLFQHHDAITGTSKANVMRDYMNRLYESIQDTVKLQQQTIELLVQLPSDNFQQNFIISELERDNSIRMPRKTPAMVTPEKNVEVVLFNSLAQERVEVVLLRVVKPNVKVIDANGNELPYQINPVFNVSSDNQDLLSRKIVVSTREYELMFLAKLAPLSLTVFTIKHENNNTKSKMAIIYCEDCRDTTTTSPPGVAPIAFDIRSKQTGDIQVENSKMKLLFDGESGFLKSMTRKNWGRTIQMGIKFGAYKSAQFHSGAYLFRPESNDPRSAEKDIFENYQEKRIMITTGPILSDVTVIHGAFLAHTVRIFKSHTYLDTAIYIENDIDFENPPKNRETEMFMRFNTPIENGEEPEFYSDLNGFQWQPRKKVSQIGIEGNFFPITASAFIQDNQMRLTLMTTHAQAAASLEAGQLEVMLDRRTLYDDYRGMGEGVVDSRLTRHQFWVTMEFFDGEGSDRESSTKVYNVPSLMAQHLTNSLNYPANIYYVEKYDETQRLLLDKNVQLFSYHLPCDLHLVNLRTLTESNLPLFPSRSALLIVQRFGYDCRLSNDLMSGDESYAKSCSNNKGQFSKLNLFRDIHVEQIHRTTLTALKSLGAINSFSTEPIEQMELRTFNMTFV